MSSALSLDDCEWELGLKLLTAAERAEELYNNQAADEPAADHQESVKDLFVSDPASVALVNELMQSRRRVRGVAMSLMLAEVARRVSSEVEVVDNTMPLISRMLRVLPHNAHQAIMHCLLGGWPDQLLESFTEVVVEGRDGAITGVHFLIMVSQTPYKAVLWRTHSREMRLLFDGCWRFFQSKEFGQFGVSLDNGFASSALLDFILDREALDVIETDVLVDMVVRIAEVNPSCSKPSTERVNSALLNPEVTDRDLVIGVQMQTIASTIQNYKGVEIPRLQALSGPITLRKDQATEVLNNFKNVCGLPTCQKSIGATLLCSRCRCTTYCSQEHQREHYKQHKLGCWELGWLDEGQFADLASIVAQL